MNAEAVAKQFFNRLEFERDLWSREFTLVAGVDEAGRGPLAGPVVAEGILAAAKVIEEMDDLPPEEQGKP